MTRTEAERLTRIEVLLEAAVTQRNEDRTAMRETIDEMASALKQIKADMAADKAELASLKNKGIGLLIGFFMLRKAGKSEPAAPPPPAPNLPPRV